MVRKYRLQSNVTFKNAFEELDPKEYKVLHNGEKWIIYYPLNKRAACYLGANATWCTTWGEHTLNPDFKDRQSHYERYNSTESDHLYILVNKADPEKERYQFHFGSKQFMNLDDRQINLQDFLTKNPEITLFFFPSLKDQTNSESDFEKQRVRFLPPKYREQFIQQIFRNGEYNELITAIIEQDTHVLDQFMENNQNLQEFDFNDGEISFVLRKLPSELEDVYYFIKACDSADEEASNYLYEDMKDYTHSDPSNMLDEVFNTYYEKNKLELKNTYGIKTLESFSELFLQPFLTDTSIQQAFAEVYSEINETILKQHIEGQKTEITNIIDIDQNYYRHSGYDVEINIIDWIEFLMEQNIDTLNGKLDDTLSNFVDSRVDVPEYPDQYEVNFSYPEYGKSNSEALTIKVDSYFDDQFLNDDDDYEDNSEQRREECLALQTKLTGILNKYFNNSNVAENEINKVEILKAFVNCNNATVEAKITNKKTNETTTGPIKIDQIVTYLQNHQLYEQLERQISLIKLLK